LDSHDDENRETVVRGDDEGEEDKMQRAKEGAEEGDGEHEKMEDSVQVACAKRASISQCQASISPQGQATVVSIPAHACADKVKTADACGVKEEDAGAKEERLRAVAAPHLPPHLPHHLCNLDDLPGPDELLRYDTRERARARA
jgi:hypothetical protein